MSGLMLTFQANQQHLIAELNITRLKESGILRGEP
jgi:hypothetical protein